METKYQIAAKWWGDFLRTPHTNDNGDAMQSALMNFAASASRQPVPADKLAKFEESLAAKLEAQGDKWQCVGVDYNPDLVLNDALTEAGISGDLNFPCKTYLWIEPDKVICKVGYGAPIETLWEC